MKTKKIFLLLFVAILSSSVFSAKKSISFNVLVSGKSEKAVLKKMKKQEGVYSVKSISKMSTFSIEYNDEKTDVNKLTNVFKELGVYASPVGESCANKPGGCLNNKPTTTNTMR